MHVETAQLLSLHISHINREWVENRNFAAFWEKSMITYLLLSDVLNKTMNSTSHWLLQLTLLRINRIINLKINITCLDFSSVYPRKDKYQACLPIVITATAVVFNIQTREAVFRIALMYATIQVTVPFDEDANNATLRVNHANLINENYFMLLINFVIH